MTDFKRTSSSNDEKGSALSDNHVVSTAALHTTGTKRVINRRQVNLYSIGGVIGTAVFVSIGSSLTKGGPLMLLLAYIIWCAVIWCVNECQGEMVCALPIESSFTRFAERYVDDAFGVATGWNYFLCMTSLLCFEITAFHSVLGFWSDNIHPAIIPAAMLASYCILHLWTSAWFAESEFWVVLCKITLMIGLFFFTFVTMVGGNPLGDAFGFRAWRDPGPVAEYLATGASGQFQGFWACLLGAAFAVAGPDMLSMIAGEAINPRRIMPTAFKTVFYRLIIFFVLSALAVGILVPYNDAILISAIKSGLPGAGRSPYVAAMTRLQVPVLPHIVNAGILTSIYSAGSAFAFNGSRVLHGLALDGYAPKFITKVNRNGVPWVAFLITAGIGCLSFLQCSAGTSKVLDWFISVATATQLVTWIAMCTTYLRWRKACQVQGVSRDSLPYKSWAQPYAAWIGLIGSIIVTLGNGYSVFTNGGWVVADFIFAYGSPMFFCFCFCARKLYNRVGFVKSSEAELWTGIEEVEEHEASLVVDVEGAPTTKWQKAKSWII